MKDSFTYQEILEAQNAAMQLGMISVPQKTAYRLSRIMDRLRTSTNIITREKMDLYKKYGTETKPGSGEYKIPDEKLTEFKGIWETFLEQKMDIEYMPIAVNMFQQLPAAAICGMGRFMIEEEKIISRE
jgi:hypothetical protein